MENQIFEKFTENTFEAYSKATKAELLELAKVLKISGRHNMSKAYLIDNIIASRIACETFNSRLNNNDNIFDDEENENMDNNNIVTTAEETNFDTSFTEEKFANAEDEYAVQIGTESKKSQDDYINNIEVGMIIAFKVSPDKAISAKVEDIDYDIKNENEGSVLRTLNTAYCRTKNGIEYKVPRKAIIWVKTGARWPRGIFLQLKKGAEIPNNNSYEEEQIENIIDES